MLTVLLFGIGGYYFVSHHITAAMRGFKGDVGDVRSVDRLGGIFLGSLLGAVVALLFGSNFVERQYVQEVVLENISIPGPTKYILAVGSPAMLMATPASGTIRYLDVSITVIEEERPDAILRKYKDVMPKHYYWLFGLAVNRGYEARVPRGGVLTVPNYSR